MGRGCSRTHIRWPREKISIYTSYVKVVCGFTYTTNMALSYSILVLLSDLHIFDSSRRNSFSYSLDVTSLSWELARSITLDLYPFILSLLLRPKTRTTDWDRSQWLQIKISSDKLRPTCKSEHVSKDCSSYTILAKFEILKMSPLILASMSDWRFLLDK